MSDKKVINFHSKSVKVVGDLYTPADFDESKKYSAIVMTPPFPQVRNQALANYGPKFAEAGYVALAFDYVSKGDSDSYTEGFRNDDDFPLKWEALRNAISFLGAQNFVDTNNIFGFGMCGGGNIMSSTIITDLRVKAYATVSAMMATDMIQFADKEAFKALVTAANEARQKTFETGEPVQHDFFGYTDPDFLEKNPGLAGGQLEGYDYYGTARGGTETHPNFSNVLMSHANETAVLNLGEHYADKIVQPYCGIVGELAETRICTDAFYAKVTAEKELHEIAGASHVALYDKPEYVKQVADIVTTFFGKHTSK